MALRNLDDLMVFIQVVEGQSFSAAARELQLAPKTVSKQIARLEQALGTTLFERNTRRFRITSEGHAIAERARVALAALQDMQELAKGATEQLTGTIRLTAPIPFGRKYVAPAIVDFCNLHPNVRFDLRLSDHVQDLYRGGLDLAIRMGELSDSRLLAQRVADNRRILTASPSYLKTHGYPTQPEELAEHNCLIFAYPGLLHNHWSLSNGQQQSTILVNGNLCSDNGEVLHAWCMAGMGISLRETWDVQQQLQQGLLVRVLPAWQATMSNISLVRARREAVPRRLSAFTEFLRQRWQDAPWDVP